VNQTLKVSSALGHHVKRDGFACQDEGQWAKPLGSRMVMSACFDSVQARLASLRELQSQTQEELDALLPSVLDRAFSGRL
jgi:hypothetical protein